MELEPMVGQNAVVIFAVADASPHAVVLKTAVNPVRITTVHRDRIELRNVQIVEKKKALSAIIRYGRTFIVTDVEAIAVGGIDP